MSEITGWSCCGASAGHQTDRMLAASLAAANLSLAKNMGLDMVVNCAACYSRTKAANHEVISSPEARRCISDAIGSDYDGSVKVRHFVEILNEDVGIEKIRGKIKKQLSGLKVACYYGCFLVRPHEVTKFDDAENPMLIDNLVTAIGGESIEWPCKVECCGGGLNLTRTDVTVGLSSYILDMAKESGTECIAVACPMCQVSLDMRQKEIEAKTGKRYKLPIFYITQLLGLCLGISPKALGINRLMVDPQEIVKMIEDVGVK
jgi:heterodisulfide reductase subunit B